MTPLVVGHRGAAAVAPENTLSGFARGAIDGADVIELDVHLTADGVLAVIHDATVDRVAVAGRRSGSVAELTWPQLQQVVLAQQERIPSLPEALAAIDVPIHLELKTSAPAAAAGAVEAIRGAGISERVTLTSFRPDALRAVRAASSEIAVGVIVDAPTPGTTALVDELDATSLAVGVRHLAEIALPSLQRRGVAVTAWPVLDTERLERAVRAGVDLVCADDPAWCHRALAAGSAPSPDPSRDAAQQHDAVTQLR